MGTSIGQAIDYLLTGTNPISATTLAAALTVADSSAVLVDSILTQKAQSIVVIGKDSPDSVTAETGSQQLLVLGAGRAQEEYDIPCYVLAWRNGPTLKPARDAAITLFDVVAKFIAQDRTLNGVLLQGRVAHISSVTLNQDVAGDTGAARVVWLSFSIHCQNHYIP